MCHTNSAEKAKIEYKIWSNGKRCRCDEVWTPRTARTEENAEFVGECFVNNPHKSARKASSEEHIRKKLAKNIEEFLIQAVSSKITSGTAWRHLW